MWCDVSVSEVSTSAVSSPWLLLILLVEALINPAETKESEAVWVTQPGTKSLNFSFKTPQKVGGLGWSAPKGPIVFQHRSVIPTPPLSPRTAVHTHPSIIHPSIRPTEDFTTSWADPSERSGTKTEPFTDLWIRDVWIHTRYEGWCDIRRGWGRAGQTQTQALSALMTATLLMVLKLWYTPHVDQGLPLQHLKEFDFIFMLVLIIISILL